MITYAASRHNGIQVLINRGLDSSVLQPQTMIETQHLVAEVVIPESHRRDFCADVVGRAFHTAKRRRCTSEHSMRSQRAYNEVTDAMDASQILL